MPIHVKLNDQWYPKMTEEAFRPYSWVFWFVLWWGFGGFLGGGFVWLVFFNGE